MHCICTVCNNLPSQNSNRRGDLFVHIVIEIPNKLSKQQPRGGSNKRKACVFSISNFPKYTAQAKGVASSLLVAFISISAPLSSNNSITLAKIFNCSEFVLKT